MSVDENYQKGVDRRSKLDAEGVRALLLINGGGAIALLALIQESIFAPILKCCLFAIVLYQAGLACAVAHNRMLRKCSLDYDIGQGFSPQGADPCGRRWLEWFAPHEPCSCCWSMLWWWSSIGAFVLAGLIVAVAAFIRL